MIIAKTINEVRQAVSQAKQKGQKVGLVPTMGALHAGHVSLIREAAKQTDFVVVSVFVNPTQFGPNEDFDKYPRNLNADADVCEKAGADVVFAPEVNEMYPKQLDTWVNVEGKLTETLCGASRPGHFRGVATVCTKLFNIVLPDLAFFGQKDAQQVAVIKNMVKDLNMPLEIVACPIIREESGLAMSSRNKYLSETQREQAAVISRSLRECEAAFLDGETDCAKLKLLIMTTLSEVPTIEPEYICFVYPDTLEPLDEITDRALVAIAVRLGPARLIDNKILSLNK